VSNETQRVKVGKTKSVLLCAKALEQIGHRTLGFKSTGSPYFFVRERSLWDGTVTRRELARFLLQIDWPCEHLNGDETDFTLDNLRIAPSKPDYESQDESPKYDATNLDAIAQVEKLNEIYPALLKKAGAIIGDPIPDPEKPDKKLDEARGPEIVAKVVARLVERVWAGEEFPNIVALAKASVQKSAEQELWAKNLEQSPIRVDAGHKNYLKRFEERFGPNAFLSTDGVMYRCENQDGASE
jgi:hypothetical protein